jgi:hypothetical protein
LHQRWGKVKKRTEGDNIRAQACRDANASRLFTRIVQRRNLPWEKDSIARAAYDPAHIPDCNVQATVGQHFIFSEPIPKAGNGRGYLRVTKKSLWWQTAQFPTDLLRLVYEETHVQNILEASGYRTPTWRILRALQSTINANVVVGESIITAAAFFEGAGRPSQPFWGPKVKAHRGEPLNEKLTHRRKAHDSYHRNIDNGQHALRQ